MRICLIAAAEGGLLRVSWWVVVCRPLNVIKIITSKKSLVISFVLHSWFCQSELRFWQTKVNLLAGHLEMTGKQINLSLKNRKTNRLLAHTILRF